MKETFYDGSQNRPFFVPNINLYTFHYPYKDRDDPLSLSLASSIKKAFDSYKEKKGGDVDDDKELEARQVSFYVFSQTYIHL